MRSQKTIVYAGETRHAQNNNKDSMKNLYNLLFDYAVSRELVDKNYARDVYKRQALH